MAKANESKNESCGMSVRVKVDTLFWPTMATSCTGHLQLSQECWAATTLGIR